MVHEACYVPLCSSAAKTGNPTEESNFSRIDLFVSVTNQSDRSQLKEEDAVWSGLYVGTRQVCEIRLACLVV